MNKKIIKSKIKILEERMKNPKISWVEYSGYKFQKEGLESKLKKVV
jgi:hypothetical protein